MRIGTTPTIFYVPNFISEVEEEEIMARTYSNAASASTAAATTDTAALDGPSSDETARIVVVDSGDCSSTAFGTTAGTTDARVPNTRSQAHLCAPTRARPIAARPLVARPLATIFRHPTYARCLLPAREALPGVEPAAHPDQASA